MTAIKKKNLSKNEKKYIDVLSLSLSVHSHYNTILFVPLYIYQSADPLPGFSNLRCVLRTEKKIRSYQRKFLKVSDRFSCNNPFAGFAYDIVFIFSPYKLATKRNRYKNDYISFYRSYQHHI